MKLSIITINLNDKDGLQRTIESVICQNFTDYEFIIIDGGSQDGSIDMIDRYKDKIAYSVSEKDTGIYNAMNKGIRQAKGEYCHFLNSGDRLASSDVLSKIFDNDPHDSFICGNFITEKNRVLTKETPYKNRDWTFSLYDIYSGDLCHQAFFIKADNFTKYELYNESFRITSDWRLFFIAIGIHHEPVKYKNVDIVIYNMEGLSSQIGGKVIYEERRKTAQEVLSQSVADKLNRLYYLEQNSYITDIIKSRKWISFAFRIFCKLGKILGFVKE
ncbi:glycosyltransferase family 2 protein [Dysgonomonas sp. ZJ709]|uniref:glycosyltransferase family 2 protein n=1 Tax=Dysgonomonas sp. ZJ709 TaxID=2709797 RepID=UPI0013EE0A77|nr:glycosyltransferase family 2 protein [Dysgonomonas sp. ZJ709]